MIAINTSTDSMLQFAMADCYAAVRAMPENPKAPQYLEEARQCQAELLRRDTVRSMRRDSRMVKDPLQYDIATRRHVRTTSDYIRKVCKSAQVSRGIWQC